METNTSNRQTEFEYVSPVSFEKTKVTLTEQDFYSMPKPIELGDRRKCILVGEKRAGGRVEVDMVNLSICKMLNNGRMELLDHADIQEDSVFYLVTHGEPYRQTLDGRKVSEVAKLLVKAGYTKDKKIVLTACNMEQKVMSHSNTLEQLLIHELKKALKEANLDSSLSAKKIETFGAGKTILLNVTGENPQMFVVSPIHRDKIAKALKFQKQLTIFKSLTAKLTDEKDQQLSRIIDNLYNKLDIMERFKYGLIAYFYKDLSLYTAMEPDLFVAHRVFTLTKIALSIACVASVLNLVKVLIH